jgi:hypothetical protein
VNGTPRPARDEPAFERRVAAARVALDTGVAEAAWAAGSTLTLDDAVAVALADEPVEAAAVGVNVFRREGDVWTIAYAGRTVRLRDARGLRYLHVLLGHPDREFHVAQLASELQAPAEAAAGFEVLDAQARAAYRERVEELRDTVEEAQRFGDVERAARAQAELEFLLQELGAAVGLGGRSRRTADSAERARKAVSNRIRAAVARISGEHPPLGRHLERAVRTGSFCSYTPEQPVHWEL